MHHSEGGWPKDLSAKDPEQTVRYKRKVEKDELYVHTMLQLLPVITLSIFYPVPLIICNYELTLLYCICNCFVANGAMYFTK